jgi:predicted acetyltransferase
MRRQGVEVVIGEVWDKPVFRNLMQLYLYDFSEHDRRDPDPHGLFDYGYLDHYWTSDWRDDGWVPFLVRVEGRLAGFALKGGRGYSHLGRNDTEHSITEFFVMRKWRGSGVGCRVAFELFDRFSGRWEVAQKRTNVVAQSFWRSVIGEYTGGDFENVDSRTPGWDGFVQCFVSGGR